MEVCQFLLVKVDLKEGPLYLSAIRGGKGKKKSHTSTQNISFRTYLAEVKGGGKQDPLMVYLQIRFRERKLATEAFQQEISDCLLIWILCQRVRS